MSFKAKRALVHFALLLLTLWPGVHIWLVKSYGVSAWKLAGWGMYAVPRPKSIGMEIFYRQRGATEYQRLRRAPEAVKAGAKNFIEHYRWLGLLAGPQDFAGKLLSMSPDWERVQVVLFQPSLDRGSGMMVMREDRFTEPSLP